MKKGLLKEALVKYISGFILLGLLLFVPADTISWPNGWLFMFLLFVPMFIAGILMYLKAPNLLRSRLKAKETQDEQKSVISLSAVMFIASFVLSGLNYRFGWLQMPKSLVIIGSVIFVMSYVMFGEVLRENEYLSRTIEVQEGQHVVDTGLYGIVRHPMYSATIFLFLSMPIVLGSVISFFIMLFYIPLIVKRIRNEEVVLEKDLIGYSEYKDKVKYRLVPFIW
ncbi:MAG: isoprenylcysteine carboxylmethyltransferase family protein [Oscillospiraceae bacterium]|nr:isoprenylcysteine carboxylmethyltransferase family protein [Oscillospiraceae bacterium]